MRPIDADALMDNIRKHCIIPGWCYPLIELEINQAPTIEAVPVVHGEWISNLDANGKLKSVWRGCSVCGCLNYSTEPNFCPDCGAKMDGKVV